MKLTELKGIGEKTAALLNKLSVYSVEDLVDMYPRSFDVYEKPCLVSELPACADQPAVAVDARVAASPYLNRTGRLAVLSVTVRDERGDRLKCTWFNMPYLASSLKTGCRYVFRGRVVFRNGSWTMEQPLLHTLDEYSGKLGQMQPIYPLTKGLSNKIVTKAIHQALELCVSKAEPLPDSICSQYGLCSHAFARNNIHFPERQEAYMAARKRLIFDEFFLFMLNVGRMKENNENASNGWVIENDSRTDEFIQRLPYKLTGAQEAVWQEIKQNMAGERLMNRLIQGDVGSGKTIVALLALLNTCFAGHQGAMMVPTEVLAIQQYEDVTRLLGENGIPIRTSLLIGSMSSSDKKRERERIASGEAGIVIGTHALIQESVHYKSLALVITDEQHRFGVHQRERLYDKGLKPHSLVMSATPIPRTLAIILYGDLDISIINQRPSNRLPIKNCVVDQGYRPNAYRFIEKQVLEGRQAYVICPMVEAGKDGDVMEDGLDGSYTETNRSASLENVVDYAARLRGELSGGITVEYLHGKMKADQKNRIMERFNSGEVKVLVSTTVIEVGVNVPNATVMMIENADRFGLAQLHQLRGRVGRGTFQSYCIFVAGKNARQENIDRLKVLEGSNDGFKIAEEDLRLRGPGDFFGVRQSGDMSFRLADVFRDADVLKQASEAVKGVLSEDPGIVSEKYRCLREWLEEKGEESVVL
jgi:ATP-dependent DNA helicase RecG